MNNDHIDRDQLDRDHITRPDTESDVDPDPDVVSSRAYGGDPHQNADTDARSTTGTGVNGPFVGRVAGDDPGAHGTSGAEARAEHEDRHEER